MRKNILNLEREKGRNLETRKAGKKRPPLCASFPPFPLSRFLRIFPAFLSPKFKSRIVLIPFYLLLLSKSAFADGGAVLAQQVAGPYRVTLFGSPAPLRAGPADLSVMVQDAKTGDAILDRSVTIKIAAAAEPGSKAWVPPCCSMKTSTATVNATHGDAQNKLLYAANVILPASGPHDFTIRIGDDEEFLRARVTVDAPPPPLRAYWAYLAFPPIAIVGFALNQRLRRRSNGT